MILQTFCVRGKEGVVVFVAVCKGFVLLFSATPVFSETIVILQTFCVRIERWACCGLWLFVKASFGYFRLRQFFLHLVYILQTFCVWGKEGLVVVLQTFCIRVENWACFVLQNLQTFSILTYVFSSRGC